MRYSKALIALAAAILIGAVTPAGAVDGCRVLLCLAGPWQRIAACVSEVEQLFQDLWDGDPFPSCRLAGGAPYTPDLSSAPTLAHANAANTWLAQWVPAPDPNCPPPYVTTFPARDRTMYGCRYIGMIAVRVDGQLWSKTYWNVTGASVTELSAGTELPWRMRSVQGIADSQARQTTPAARAGGGGGD
jgi:hypothetical protein